MRSGALAFIAHQNEALLTYLQHCRKAGGLQAERHAVRGAVTFAPRKIWWNSVGTHIMVPAKELTGAAKCCFCWAYLSQAQSRQVVTT